MHRLIAISLLGLVACGGSKKKPVEPVAETTDDAGTSAADSDAGAEKKDECVGFDIGDIESLLAKSACEEPDRPDTMQTVDLKGKLEVTVAASPSKLGPGGKADLIVSFKNKSAAPLTLHFKLNPVARFDVEVYDKKNKRADLPKGKEPPPPAGATQGPPSETKSAKITIAANGSAHTKVAWDAQRQKWAPEKFKGTPPERGFPHKADGPLPAGKYSVKVITPLIGVVDLEMAQPKVDVEIGK